MDEKLNLKRQRTAAIMMIAAWACILAARCIDCISSKFTNVRTVDWILIICSIVIIICEIVVLVGIRKKMKNL